jgi:hemerythrin-like domain-containing protein
MADFISAQGEKQVTSPLLKDHAKIRELLGELKANTTRYDLPLIRKNVQALKDEAGQHTLKEETVLFLIGMKFLRADNSKLPELIREHHQTASRLSALSNLLYSPRMMDAEDQIQQLIFVLSESMDDHMTDEESIVFPALEKLIDAPTKELILTRYQSVAFDNFDEFDRSPLLSLPDAQDNSGLTTPLNKPVGP